MHIFQALLKLRTYLSSKRFNFILDLIACIIVSATLIADEYEGKVIK